jgi:putative FmdB family regulatory protein
MCPFYDYVCKECGHKFEIIQSMKDATLKKCPQCKKRKLYRVINAPFYLEQGTSPHAGMTPQHITLGNKRKKTKRNS